MAESANDKKDFMANKKLKLKNIFLLFY